MSERDDSTMRPGDAYLVYQDPATRQDLEGAAVLVKRISDRFDPELGARWLVAFVGDEPGDEYERWVHPHERSP